MTNNNQRQVSKAIILDLLPLYIAGEISDDSKQLVETFAKQDSEINAMIQMGEQMSAGFSQEITPDKNLHQATLQRVRSRIRRQMAYVVMTTIGILMIPLIAMQFTAEVQWDMADFLVMGLLLIACGAAYVLLSKLSDYGHYRLAMALTILGCFLLIWINLAVGLMGSEDHPANLLYLAVILTAIVGTIFCKAESSKMSTVLYLMAGIEFLIPPIALLIWQPSLQELGGVAGIILLNGFFVGLFAVAGYLFRRS